MKWRRPTLIIPIVVLVLLGPVVLVRGCSEKPQQAEVEQLLRQLADHTRQNLPQLNALATQPDRETEIYEAQVRFNGEHLAFLDAAVFNSAPPLVEEARQRWANSLRRQIEIWDRAASEGRTLTDEERGTLQEEFTVSGQCYAELAKYAAPRRGLF